MKGKNNKKALMLLIIMFIGFILSLYYNNGIFMVVLQSGFEAGVVGGFADWFAVVAIFRHPLGIPIPHTALLPKNRERITEALVSIVENNLLDKESILDKVHKLELVNKALNAGKTRIYSKKSVFAVRHILNEIINYVAIEKISEYLLDILEDSLKKIESKNVLDRLGNECLKNNYEEKLFNMALTKGEELVKEEETKSELAKVVFNAISNVNLGGLMQHTLSTFIAFLGDDKISQMAQDLILSILRDLKTEDNSTRLIILEEIRKNIKNISSNESLIEKVDGYKNNMAYNVELNIFLNGKLKEIKTELLNKINDDDYIEKNILPILEKLIIRVSEDKILVSKLENYTQETVSEYVSANHKKIGNLVRDNLSKLNTEELTELIEDRVGDDLQWIRINGAICGFIVGIILGIIKIIAY